MNHDEWYYLCCIRKMNSVVARFYMVDLESKGNQIGLLLPPDQATADDVFGLASEGQAPIPQNVNIGTYIDKGFVFLPAAGHYLNNSWNNAGGCGYYWTTTEYNNANDEAYYLPFYIGGVVLNVPNYTNVVLKNNYLSVRLVHD